MQQPSSARPWNPAFKHTDRERWICVYPAYINGRRTVQEGRRVPKNKAVDNPTYSEIKDVLGNTLPIGIENKVYPKELDHRDQKCRGRIRVQLKDENGDILNKDFPTRKSVLMYLCDTIPKLKTRQQSSSQSSQPQSQPAQSTKTQKKKGRKGK